MQTGIVIDATGQGHVYCPMLGAPGQWSAIEHTDQLATVLPDMLLFLQCPETIPAHITMPVLVNDTQAKFAIPENDRRIIFRFCGWPTLFERTTWEIAAYHSPQPLVWLPAAEKLLGKKLSLVANVPGFVAPRMIATIVNEACHGLADDLCSETDLDLAMRLGTNYPKGPMQWCKEIGKQNIYALLSTLALQDSRYAPHPFLNPE